ncbi:MAG: hypothetical protein IH948_07005, partial [Bacteroidetes bacterium]|nr:hypothetical protein [Bacteroidota bacterium]
DYKKDDPFSMWESRSLNETLSQRQKIISEYLLKNGEFHCRNILFIVVLGRIGRSISLARGKLIKNARELVISAYDLRVVTLLRDCDNLTLWKFSGAKDKFIQSLIVPFIGFSFLDIYSAYIERHHSLYLDDNRKFSIVHINAGYGQPLRIKSIQSNDRHLAQKDSPPKYVSVIRYSLDKSIPIYMIEYSPLNTFGLLIEGYTQPIWVQMENVAELYSNETRSLYDNFIDLLSYWLWQLTPSLRPHLEVLGETPYLINFEIKDPEKWSEYGRADEETNGSIAEMRYDHRKRIVEITFSYNTMQRLRGADNEGERLILKDLLTLYGEILVDSGFENTLSSEEIGTILERHAPRGLKKKFLLFNTNKNSSLNPNDIPKSRILQEHDVEASLDNLVEALGDKAPPVGSIENKKIGSELCKEIVVIYRDRLRVMLTNYDWKSLLSILIGYHEAILNLIAVKRLRLPTTMECYSNVHTEVKNLAKEFPMVESTAIALRTLIEIIAAEPPNGDSILSIDEIDKLLANTYQLFKWASISDQIHYDVFDIKISILPSGRVGIERDEYLNKWEPFYESKMREGIELTLRSHKGRFVDKVSKIEDLDDLPKYDEAFRTEFGLSMTQLIELGVSLTDLGFENANASSHMLMSALKNELASRLEWDSTDINRGIDFLSLKPREKWEIPPEGYEYKDIWPWRYNRLLSYLRRPIIIGPEPKNDPMVYWGPRQVEASVKHLLGLVFEGHYQSGKDGSDEMKILIGSILNKAGKQFNIEVSTWLSMDQNLQVELNVSIKPNGTLKADSDLGDIDILVIDNINRIVFSIECKKAKFARIAPEMANEFKNLLDESKSKDSWIAKHSRRDKWLKSNKAQLSTKFDIQDTSFKIISLIITEVEIPATYIKEVPLPIIPFSRLKREGISLLFDKDRR